MNILFLCTANSCRSILAEAIFNHLAPTHIYLSSQELEAALVSIGRS